MEKFRFCIKNKDRKEIRIMEVIIRKAKEKEGKDVLRLLVSRRQKLPVRRRFWKDWKLFRRIFMWQSRMESW